MTKAQDWARLGQAWLHWIPRHATWHHHLRETPTSARDVNATTPACTSTYYYVAIVRSRLDINHVRGQLKKRHAVLTQGQYVTTTSRVHSVTSSIFCSKILERSKLVLSARECPSQSKWGTVITLAPCALRRRRMSRVFPVACLDPMQKRDRGRGTTAMFCTWIRTSQLLTSHCIIWRHRDNTYLRNIEYQPKWID